MNIWAWTDRLRADLRDSGHGDLAAKLWQFPMDVSAHRHDRVEAAYPELLAAARTLANPWMEVFVRHWRLQSLNLRRDATRQLAEAVEALEFSHREETRSCPQSVCTVQDVCLAYGNVDGPGYVEERLAVVGEILERIDPTWSCYRCISIEEADALRDGGRLAESAVVVRRRHAEYAMAHGSHEAPTLAALASALQSAGEHEESLALARDVEGLRPDDDDLVSARLTQCAALIALGRPEEAAALLPSTAAVAEFDAWSRWGESHLHLVQAGHRDNSVVDAVALSASAADFLAGGSFNTAFNQAEVVLRLAALRGARQSALAALAMMERARAGLRTPSRVDDRLVAARVLIDGIPPIELPCAAEELAAHLDEQDEIQTEPSLDLVELALEARPDDTALLLLRARLLAALRRGDEADAAVWSMVEADPSSEDLANAFLQVRWDDNAALTRLAALVRGDQPTVAAWAEANVAFRTKDFETVVDRCAAIVASDPSVVNTRRMWAVACRHLGRHAEEQQVLQQIVDLGGDVDPSDRWELLTAASIEGDWAVVRRESAALGITLDGDEGPVDERWSYVRIRFADAADDGTNDPDLLAIRTGPVTALVVGANHVEAPHQRYEDRIVFHSAPLNQRPEDPEEDWEPLFRHIATVQPGGYRTFEVEGEWPGEEAWDAVRQAIKPADLRRWSGTEFRLHDHVTDTEIEAIYAMYLVPPEWSTEEAAQRLTELTADWPSPLFWAALAEAAGLDPEPHRERARRYGYE